MHDFPCWLCGREVTDGDICPGPHELGVFEGELKEDAIWRIGVLQRDIWTPNGVMPYGSLTHRNNRIYNNHRREKAQHPEKIDA